MSIQHSVRAAGKTGRSNEVGVLFYLQTREDWPPYPSEVVAAELVDSFVVEVTGIPRSAYGISRGDRVAVSHDGSGFVGRHVKQFGGHSTARVVAASAAELEPIMAALTAAGASAEYADQTTMLAIDIPDDAVLSAVSGVLEKAVSMTCNYEIASTPKGYSE